jgi:hypothetical protein
MNRLLVFFITLFLLPSCKNLVPYTDALRQSNGWSDDQMKKIQFYTSDAVVLQRKLSSESTEIVDGKIKMENGQRIEEVIIRERTPGVLVGFPRDKAMSISFEKSDDYFLKFGQNPNQNNRYCLLASEWTNRRGKIKYHGKDFTTSASGAEVFLMVDLRKLRKEDVNLRVAKGRKVN